MKKYIKYIPQTILAIGIALCVINLLPKATIVQAAQEFNSWWATSTSTARTVTTSSQTIMASSSARVYASIQNDGVGTCYLSIMNGAQAATSTGIRLNASGGSFEILPENLYLGQINAICTASSIITITAKQ